MGIWEFVGGVICFMDVSDKSERPKVRLTDTRAAPRKNGSNDSIERLS